MRGRGGGRGWTSAGATPSDWSTTTSSTSIVWSTCSVVTAGSTSRTSSGALMVAAASTSASSVGASVSGLREGAGDGRSDASVAGRWESRSTWRSDSVPRGVAEATDSRSVTVADTAWSVVSSLLSTTSGSPDDSSSASRSSSISMRSDASAYVLVASPGSAAGVAAPGATTSTEIGTGSADSLCGVATSGERGPASHSVCMKSTSGVRRGGSSRIAAGLSTMESSPSSLQSRTVPAWTRPCWYSA